MLHIRIERELKGREMAESMVISVHLTVTYRENHSAICLNIFFWLLPSLFASPLVWNFSLHWHSCSGKEQWGVAEVYKTIFKCKQRHSQPSSHICLCLQICLLLSFFHTWPKIFTPTHTQILGVVLYPIIPIHTPFQMFNHCRGLWDTVLIGEKKKK